MLGLGGLDSLSLLLGPLLLNYSQFGPPLFLLTPLFYNFIIDHDLLIHTQQLHAVKSYTMARVRDPIR